MKFDALRAMVEASERPVILLEGTRALGDAERPALVRVGRMLAERLPRAVFRSGNAPGSDEAFAEGVASVDAGRLEIVQPHPGHRRASIPAGAYATDVGTVSARALRELALTTGGASPRHLELAKKYSARKERLGPKPEAIIRLILRDTLKVVGDPTQGLAPATVGIFRENPDDPETGGTGHTIRCCRATRVPYLLRRDWRGWR